METLTTVASLFTSMHQNLSAIHNCISHLSDTSQHESELERLEAQRQKYLEDTKSANEREDAEIAARRAAEDAARREERRRRDEEFHGKCDREIERVEEEVERMVAEGKRKLADLLEGRKVCIFHSLLDPSRSSNIMHETNC